MSNFCCTFAAAKVKRPQKLINMEAMLKQTSYDFEVDVMERPLIDPDWRSKPTYSWEEVYEELCKDLGKHYGLNDIREAK